MKHKIYISIVAVFALLSITGCEEQKLTTYSGDYFVQFAKKISDSTNVSFMFYPYHEGYIDFPIALELVGVASPHELTYKVSVDAQYTTATNQQYSLPSVQVLRANRYVDTLYVRLNKTSDLDTKKVRLLLRIESTSDLKVGKIEQSAAVIWFSNTLAKPDWWNSDIDNFYLGEYSNKKYEMFIQITGVFDMSKFDASTKRSYALKLKQYLNDNPTLDENNQYIELPVF